MTEQVFSAGKTENVCSNADSIDISLPCKAEYVSVVRLAASRIASRVGFDVEQMEDITVAVSEVCNHLVMMKHAEGDAEHLYSSGEVGSGDASVNYYKVRFLVEKGRLTVMFSGPDEHGLFKGMDEFALALIHALMDSVSTSDDGSMLYMTKSL